MRWVLYARLARYTVVGAVATAVHYLILAAFVELFSMRPEQAAALGALVGAAVAYTGNRKLTFAVSPHCCHLHAIPRFCVTALINACLSVAVLWVGTTLLGLHYLVSQMVATGLGLCLGFVLNMKWTFAR